MSSEPLPLPSSYSSKYGIILEEGEWVDYFGNIRNKEGIIIKDALRRIKNSPDQKCFDIAAKTGRNLNVKELSRLREIRLQKKLESMFGKENVLAERTLVDAAGNRVIDPITGEGRRIHFIILDNSGVAKYSVEATSRNQVSIDGKRDQILKEDSIRDLGGTYVVHPQSGRLIDISAVQTRVVGLETLK
jgi:hypothetical protein